VVLLKLYKYILGYLGYKSLYLNKDENNTIINNSQANINRVNKFISTL
jgi:hypothetical protein